MLRRSFLVSAAVPLLAQYEESKGDVPWVPTPDEVIDAMLRMAGASRRDIVMDLGSGDGRVLLRAAKQFGAKGIGIEIEGHRVAEARAAAKAAQLDRRVKFIEQNFFDADLRPATILFLYLYTGVMAKLKPKIRTELRPGSRVVAYQFNGMGDWPPDRILRGFDYPLYLWTVR